MLQKAVFTYLAFNMDKSEKMKKIDLVFKEFDEDHDGKIAKDEFFRGNSIQVGEN